MRRRQAERGQGQEGVERRRPRRDQGRQGRIAQGEGHDQPSRRRQQPQRPAGGQDQAEEGRHPLAPLEAQPDGEQVAQEGRAAGDGARYLAVEQVAGDQQGERPLARV
ncbi:hypothetical protein D9M68_978690 [compost metagenome]